MKSRIRELEESDVAPFGLMAAQRRGISNQTPQPELYAADRAVDVAREELGIVFRDVVRAWRRASTRVGTRLRPVLVGGAAAVGMLIFARARRFIVRTRWYASSFPGRSRPTFVSPAASIQAGAERAVAERLRSASTGDVDRWDSEGGAIPCRSTA